MVLGSFHLVSERCNMVLGRSYMVLGRCHMVFGRCHMVSIRCQMVCDFKLSLKPMGSEVLLLLRKLNGSCGKIIKSTNNNIWNGYIISPVPWGD